MKIVSRVADPSREDAVRMVRSEKMGMVALAYAATILEDLQTEMKERLKMVENGTERLKKLSEDTDKLLDELRVTIPIRQRLSISNISEDSEMRLTPKAKPKETTVILGKEEFRELVDFARAKCSECFKDDQECNECGLYDLLTAILPLDNYHNSMLCPYNLGEWKN